MNLTLNRVKRQLHQLENVRVSIITQIVNQVNTRKNPPHVEITATKALVESNRKTFQVVHQYASHAFVEIHKTRNHF